VKKGIFIFAGIIALVVIAVTTSNYHKSVDSKVITSDDGITSIVLSYKVCNYIFQESPADCLTSPSGLELFEVFVPAYLDDNDSLVLVIDEDTLVMIKSKAKESIENMLSSTKESGVKVVISNDYSNYTYYANVVNGADALFSEYLLLQLCLAWQMINGVDPDDIVVTRTFRNIDTDGLVWEGVYPGDDVTLDSEDFSR
jgi:hypothetical protein